MFYEYSPSDIHNTGLYFEGRQAVTLPLPQIEHVSHGYFMPSRSLFNYEEKQSFHNCVTFSASLNPVDTSNFCISGSVPVMPEPPLLYSLNQVSQALPEVESSPMGLNQFSNSPTIVYEEFGNLKKQLSTDEVSNSTQENVSQTSVKAPSKEDLYKLSTLIQNTTSDFDNLNSKELAIGVDSYKLTTTGLYMSKDLYGFNWEFEVFFQKNKGTNRNRRHLRCKHKNCDKVFKKAWNLFDHMRIHTGKKPYTCKFCGKCFAQNGNLTKHLKLHIDSRESHQCNLCGKTYTEKFNLRVHKAKKHGLDQELDFD